MKSYIVYVSTARMGHKEAKKHVEKMKKRILKQAKKKERWIFIPSPGGRDDVIQLPS